MRKLHSLAIAAILILAGIVWVNWGIGSQSVNFGAPSGAQFDVLRAMTTAKDLPNHQYDLY
jgi:hypothetical protein